MDVAEPIHGCYERYAQELFADHPRVRRILIRPRPDGPLLAYYLHWDTGIDLTALDELVTAGRASEADFVGAVVGHESHFVHSACGAQLRVLTLCSHAHVLYDLETWRAHSVHRTCPVCRNALFGAVVEFIDIAVEQVEDEEKWRSEMLHRIAHAIRIRMPQVQTEIDAGMVVDHESLSSYASGALKEFRLSLELNINQPENQMGRQAAFERGMEILVGVQVRVAAGEMFSDAEAAEFRRDVVAAIAANTRGLWPYVVESLYAAIGSIDDGWGPACLSRSALQLLRDDYPGADELFDADPEMVEVFAEASDMLRERAPEVEPLLDFEIPQGLPDGHWWWLLPSQLRQQTGR
ncbi:hypothetical protein [Nocardia sp. NPDC050789]|uniref:hypothetical protein n=1 Tax=Nocardia sp. NPDC050789 TaxID=3154841 RepID=UPI0033F1C89E